MMRKKQPSRKCQIRLLCVLSLGTAFIVQNHDWSNGSWMQRMKWCANTQRRPEFNRQASSVSSPLELPLVYCKNMMDQMDFGRGSNANRWESRQHQAHLHNNQKEAVCNVLSVAVV
eukprot:1145822-Pelagomonas_calceolata.AAC.1